MKAKWIALTTTAVIAVQGILLLATSATGVLIIISIIKAINQ